MGIFDPPAFSQDARALSLLKAREKEQPEVNLLTEVIVHSTFVVK